MSKAVVNDAGGYKGLLTDFPVPCFIVSADRVISVGNAPAEAIAREGIAGRTASDVILEQLDALSEGRRAAWSHDREFVIQIGREAAVRFFLPQFSQSGAGWTVLFFEVSGLWEANRSMTRAFSLMGHEVKTPITSIRMSLHLLLEEKLGALNPEQRELVEASRDDCENMLNLVQQINEIFLIESGQEALSRTLVEPSQLFANPLAENQRLFERNAQQVVVSAPAEETPRLYIDVSKVERAIGELLKNAATHGVRGGNVAVTISTQKSSVRLGVTCAMASDGSTEDKDKKKTFEPFGLRKGPQGSDLGLAICKAIVNVHGGRTGIDITERGHEFYLEFPSARRA